MIVDLKNILKALEVVKHYRSKLEVVKCDISTDVDNSCTYIDVFFSHDLSMLISQKDDATSIKFFYQSKWVNMRDFDCLVEKAQAKKELHAIRDKFSVGEISATNALEKLMDIGFPKKLDADARYELGIEINGMLELFLSSYPQAVPLVYNKLSGLIDDIPVMNLIIKVHNYKEKLKAYSDRML